MGQFISIVTGHSEPYHFTHFVTTFTTHTTTFRTFITLLQHHTNSTTMYSKIACGLALAVGMTNGAAHNLVRRDGAHGHEASSSYSEPAASSYGAPAASAPASGYGAPADDLG